MSLHTVTYRPELRAHGLGPCPIEYNGSVIGCAWGGAYRGRALATHRWRCRARRPCCDLLPWRTARFRQRRAARRSIPRPPIRSGWPCTPTDPSWHRPRP